MARAVRAAGGSGQGCRGRSPRRNKLLVSPFPGGEGGRGMGAEAKLKAGVAGDKEGKPPRRVQRRHGQPTPQGASPPPGAWFAPFPSAARVQARGCKGRSPLHEITLVPPFPPGRGSGGWGQPSKLKAGAAGDTEGKPPAGYSGGMVSRHRKGQATRRVQRRQGQPAPQGASPPPGAGSLCPAPPKKKKIHCRRKIARTPCALPPNMLY